MRIETHGRDKHRRTLGTVFQDEANINQALVGDGWWFSKFVPKDAVLKQLKQEAKGAEKAYGQIPIRFPLGCIVALMEGLTRRFHPADTKTLVRVMNRRPDCY